MPCPGHASLPFSPLVSPCVKRRSRWPSSPGALILAGADTNATPSRTVTDSGLTAGLRAIVIPMLSNGAIPADHGTLKLVARICRSLRKAPARHRGRVINCHADHLPL